MGEYPMVPYVVDTTRRVNTYSSLIEPAEVGDSDQSRWMVGRVVCPHCSGWHEHALARRAGWGWFRAPCRTGAGYYLVNDPVGTPVPPVVVVV